MDGMQRTLRHVEQELQGRYPQADLTSVSAAFAFAHEAHAGQKRASGEPYVTHPLAVARILAEMGLDPVAVTAALLHDIPEDTEYSLDDIEERFGAEVARLVDGVTKLSKFSALSHEQQQAENIRKMFLAMAEDIRVVLIKLADRLHNMRTLGALPTEQAAAHRPPDGRDLRATRRAPGHLAVQVGARGPLPSRSSTRTPTASWPASWRATARLARPTSGGPWRSSQAALTEAGIEAELSGRPKHIYSIHRKMQRKRAEFGEIYDIHALRVLVDDVRDCYAALGVVHSLWRPIPGQFDDYIAMPKNNMYQSLHTAVVALDGKPLEVQIRTHEMHRVSEVGIAAHWRYKEGSRTDRAYDAKLAWLRQLMDWQTEVSDATEFVEGVKLDIFQDQVFVFTPKGDVKDLPAGATPLDFAYRIHTDVGHACIGAKVNNRLVPLDYKLKNGDIVEIVTTKSAHGPSRDWLNIVTTSHASEKIRQWFKRQQRDENIAHGRQLLDRELRRLARTSLDKIDHDQLEGIVDHYGMRSLDDFLAAIGYGPISAQQVVTKLGVVDDAERGAAAPGGAAAARAGRHPRQGRRATCWSASASAATPSRAIPSSASSRGAGASPSTWPPAPRSSTSGPWSGSSTWSGRRPPSRPTPSPSSSRPTTAPGCWATSATSSRTTRSTSWPPRGGPQGPPRHRPGHARGHLGGPAVEGHGAPRAAQGRLLGRARSRLTAGGGPRARQQPIAARSAGDGAHRAAASQPLRSPRGWSWMARTR